MPPEYTSPILYRIGILNEFRNNWAYVDFKQFGEVCIYASLWNAWPHRGYNLKDDRICVFLNFTQLVKTESKDEAAKHLTKLIEDCPPKMHKFLVEEKCGLYKALGL
jgi:hypothetical protein